MKWTVKRHKKQHGCFVRSVMVSFALYDPLPWLSEKITGLHSSACEPTFPADPCGNSGHRGFPLMVIMTLCSGATAGSRVQHLQLLWQYFVANILCPMDHINMIQHDSTCQGSSSSRDLANNATMLQDLRSLSRSLRILVSHIAKSCGQLPNETPSRKLAFYCLSGCCVACAAAHALHRG